MPSLDISSLQSSTTPRELRLESRGPEVAELQRRLLEAGFDPGATDGVFGVRTETAVKAFQKSRGLIVDGVVGPQTWSALGVHVEGAPPEIPVGSGLTSKVLREIMPRLSAARADECLPYLDAAMVEADITTPQRQAAFLAQLAFESGELRYFEELSSGEQYEGREDLGNTEPGDGRRFKGRGPIQLTGRANYRAAGQALGIDLEANPLRAGDVDVGFRVAAWFWTSRGLNALADVGDFREITRRINGGFNGLDKREAYHRRALDILSH
ncbi:peptidoglycan-binding protein [Vitiosangium sp. GDMCC 1.1324]|uniref:peptidoglycan-binding protein n=1 Tax=Vitiosangium sp. (strain GDMCC 1.1324) TaxID=2138576 RepID=UPI001E3A14F2|nr:peptidoglycan-binding protein [Vitiosangium sp. GDMCC 1.1324]